MSHDYAAQKAETVRVFEEMSTQNGMPDSADIDYFLIPVAEDANWRALADVLTRQGYACEYFDEDQDAESPYLTATLLDQAVSAQGIWIGEEVATQHALEHGFAPDGWGLEA